MKLPDDFSYAFHRLNTPMRGGRPLQCIMTGCHGLATVQVLPSEGNIRYLCATCAKHVTNFPKQAEFIYIMTHSSQGWGARQQPRKRKSTAPPAPRSVHVDIQGLWYE